MENHTPTSEGEPTTPRLNNDLIRAELKRRRLELRRSVRSLAIPRRLTAQTILNIEDGTHSPTIITLSLLCGRLGMTLKELITSALP